MRRIAIFFIISALLDLGPVSCFFLYFKQETAKCTIMAQLESENDGATADAASILVDAPDT